MSLESLIPPLALCQQLKPGDFQESALVWHKFGISGPKWGVSVRYAYQIHKEAASAPTSDEIKADLSRRHTVYARTLTDGRTTVTVHVEGKDISEIDANPATAALRLWMRVNGREMKG